MGKPKMRARPRKKTNKSLVHVTKDCICLEDADMLIQEDKIGSAKYKIIDYEYGKEIEIPPKNQPISWGELKRIVENEFAGWPSENLLVMVPGPCPLVIETEQKRIK